VPIQLKTIENDSNMTKQGDTGWMDSLDPLYAKICDIWMKILIADFGTDHVCPCSPRTARHCTFAPLASWPASAHTPHCSPRHHHNGRIANSTPTNFSPIRAHCSGISSMDISTAGLPRGSPERRLR
jgi:hypothetical protein